MNKQPPVGKKVNHIYQSGDGEYFLSVEHHGELVLSNPSYPFMFKWEVLEPLMPIGSVKEFGHLLEDKEYEFHEGKSLTVEVTNDGLKAL